MTRVVLLWFSCAVMTARVRSYTPVAVFWLLCLYCALRMYGYYHPDELGQITTFCLYKLGRVQSADMPWEFFARMRPWLQPALYAKILAPFVSRCGYNHLLAERCLLLVQWLLLSAALPVFFFALIKPEDSVKSDTRYRYAMLGLGFAWFLPSMAMRHSSEAFAMLWLALSLGLWARVEQHACAAPGRVRLLAMAAASGVTSGLAFTSRYQMALFVAGFWVARVLHAVSLSRARGLPVSADDDKLQAHDRLPKEPIYASPIGAALAVFAVGFVLCMALAVAVDTWGYGKLTFASWNYLEQNVLFDRASQFGRSPWYFYFVQASLFAVNPALFVWLGRAMALCWRQPLRRALVVGLAVFLLGHVAIAHKEIRFLLPMWPVALVLLSYMFAHDTQMPRALVGDTRGRSFFRQAWLLVFSQRYCRWVAIANIALLLAFCAFGLVRDRYRVDLMLWDLPPGTVVFSPANLYRVFDATLAPPPAASHYSQPIRKPPHVQLVYAPAALLPAVCRQQPSALVLLTNKGVEVTTAALIDRDYPEIVAEHPAWSWLATSPLLKRSWRFKLVPCQSYVARQAL